MILSQQDGEAGGSLTRVMAGRSKDPKPVMLVIMAANRCCRNVVSSRRRRRRARR